MSAYFNTTNVTQPSNCPIQSSSKAAKIGGTFACCFILVVSLAGNSLIAMIVYKTKTMRKPINYFIVNMAISDLLFPFVILPSNLIELYGGFEVFTVHLGQAFCNVRVFLIYVSSGVSLKSSVLIAVDRFVAVVFPLRAPLVSSKLCPFVILVTWLASVALSFPVFFAFKPVEYTTNMVCEWLWEDTFVSYYSSALIIIFCGICLVLIIILYFVIVFKLKSQRIPGEQSASAEEKRAKMHRNVLKMAGAIVIGFVLCWGPVSVFNFLNVFVWNFTTRFSCGVTLIYLIAALSAQTNCAVNPFICFSFSGNYRQGLKGLLGC